MAIYPHQALVLDSDSDPAPALPNPATVSGRTHDLTTTGLAACVWGSSGATPFLVDGVAAASITVTSGTSVRVQSNGTRWVVLRPSGTRRIVSTKGVTDANGTVTFAFNPPFAAAPVVTNAVETGTADATECRISALSASSVSFVARRSPAVTVLGISVLSASVPLAGATVHATAMEAG